jgi:hypothetical protein
VSSVKARRFAPEDGPYPHSASPGVAKGSKKRVALFAAVCAAAVTAAPFLGAADAKKKTKSLAGKYKGTTEEGGAVSFRLTRNAKIVGFTLTNATLYCVTKFSTQIPTRNPEYTKTVTISHGPIPMRGVSNKNPQGKKFRVSDPAPEDAARQDGVFTGKVVSMTSTPTGGTVLAGKGFRGEVSYETANGPTPFPSSENPNPMWAPGTEWCVTNAIDWDAKKPGAPGFVFRS